MIQKEKISPYLEYLGKNVCSNLEKSIINLDEMGLGMENLIKKEKYLGIDKEILGKYLYTTNQLKGISSNFSEKKKKLIEELKKINSEKCTNLNGLTCRHCYNKIIYYQKIKRKDGKRSEGNFYNMTNNMFLLLTWLFSRLDQLELQKPHFEFWIKKTIETSLFRLGEATGFFPSIFGNIVFFSWNMPVVILDKNQEVQNPVLKGAGNLFLEGKTSGYLYNNHRLILDYYKTKFYEIFKILPSLKSKTKSTQFPTSFLSAVPRFYSPNKETTRFFNNFFSVNDFFKIFENSNNKTPFFKRFNVVNEISDLQPTFPEQMCVGIIQFYKHMPGFLEINFKNLEFQKKEVNSINKKFKRRNRSSPLPLTKIKPVTSEIEETLGIADDPLDTLIEKENLLNLKKDKKSYFSSILSTYIFTYLKHVSLDTICKLSNVLISNEYNQNNLLNNTFPPQIRKNTYENQPGLKENILENNVLLHSLDGICLSPSFLQSQSFLEKLIETYSLKNQIDFVYFPSLSNNLKNHLYYALFKTKFKHKDPDFMLHKMYIDTNRKSSNILEKDKFIQYYQNKKNENEIYQIQSRVLQLMTYFKLPIKDGQKKLSVLDQFKFNKILNFIMFESLLLTQLDYYLYQYNRLLAVEDEFSKTKGFGKKNLFHSFFFKGQKEVSGSEIIDKLSFQFLLKPELICDNFLKLSIRNIETVFFYTKDVTQADLSKKPWSP